MGFFFEKKILNISFKRVLQIFNENRTRHVNEWFTLCDYLKMTSNFEVLRPILLSSFTIGIPYYAFEIKETSLSLRRFKQEDLNGLIKKVDFPEFKRFHINQSSKSRATDSSGVKSFRSKLDLPLSDRKQLLSSISGSALSQVNKESIDLSDLYEPLVDNLLDLTDLVDISKLPFGDSTNMLLLNRALILVDLMKYLDDKYFQENFSFSILQIVYNIVIQVSFIIISKNV